MNFPLYGKVVVVDDSIDEALPLLKALWSNRVPAIYFNGDDIMPPEPINSVRLIFMDLKLIDARSDEHKKIFSSLFDKLKKIITPENGPYFLILWSKVEKENRDKIVERFNLNQETKQYNPFHIIDLDKLIYMEQGHAMREDAYQKIVNEIRKFSGQLGMFYLLLEWENSCNNAAGKIINELHEFKYEGEWNHKINSIFVTLAKSLSCSYFDLNNKNEIVKNSFLAFNQIFLDTLDYEIKSKDYKKFESIEFRNPEIREEIISQINSKVLISKVNDKTVVPGNIYLASDIYLNGLCSRGIPRSFKDRTGINLENIVLEISPMCDYATNKREISRLLLGFMVPNEHTNKILRKNLNVYTSNTIYYNQKLYKLVFDFGLLTSSECSTLEMKFPLFRLKHQLLIDIQARLASHVNRPGVMTFD